MTENNKSFADKLNSLFETKTDGTRYMQEGLIRASGGAPTRVYLWKPHTGRATNPGLNAVKAIADFFGVGVDYFFENGDSKTDSPTDIVEDVNKNGLATRIAMRLTKLDEEVKKIILEMIHYILSLFNKPGSVENSTSEGELEK